MLAKLPQLCASSRFPPKEWIPVGRVEVIPPRHILDRTDILLQVLKPVKLPERSQQSPSPMLETRLSQALQPAWKTPEMGMARVQLTAQKVHFHRM